MNKLLLCMAAGLIQASLAFSGTCPVAETGIAALSAGVNGCQVESLDRQFTWDITNLQIVATNANVKAGSVTVDAAVGKWNGYDQLNLTQQITDPTALLAANHGFVVIAVDYTLSVTSNYAASAGTPMMSPALNRRADPHARTTEYQEYINGELSATTTRSRTIYGSHGVGRTYLDTATTIYVQDLIILSGTYAGNSFTNTFEIAPLVSTGPPVIPGATPEPGTWALLGCGVLGIGAYRRFRGKTVS